MPIKQDVDNTKRGQNGQQAITFFFIYKINRNIAAEQVGECRRVSKKDSLLFQVHNPGKF